MTTLPIDAHREELLAALAAHQVVVVAGETGSGKSTQLPQMCLAAGRTAVAHTQPRRLAARTLAERIAEEMGVELGADVGYAVRFDDRTSKDTRIRLMTDGLLLAEISRDRRLRRYDTVIIDEAHERSLNVDFLLGYLKRLLPERPDLKVVITSATIDPQRFAAHFGPDTPVIEVSGRTYPVTTHYRPVDDEEDPADVIAEVAQKLPGDVLVFLSGEREIRDTAEALRGRLRDTEILPLYARLATADQQRVFRRRSGSGRRIVLATNVAETSLTVPGIRSVIDPGTARISRYSARLKVQRLPIEPVSQASADQRKGRCGRVAEGVCVRLYSEEDFLERPEFTDPEILRTSLASVLLQMASLDLGAIEDFPFLDPPDARQIRDAVNLLTELGALGVGSRRLTPLGRRLARLPVDPRMGRMILEAGRRGCASEVIVIAAALTIVDPRERPTEHRDAADAQHARFAEPGSDFLSYLNLWRYLRTLRDEVSGNQFRKRIKGEYLHYLRVREWQDLNGQLRSAARAADVPLSSEPGAPDDIHRSILAGLLSHIGLRDRAKRDYQGARGARFAIFPGSGLAKKQPDWVMAAELVETSRLWARECARIDPRWIEPLARHLVRRETGDERWDEQRAQVVGTERITLHGLPIGSRTVPIEDREAFIRHALVQGEWNTPGRHLPFIAENVRRIAEVEAIEERTRQRGLLAPDSVLADFFAERLGEHVVSGRTFDRWYRDQPADVLVFPRELLRTDATDPDAGRPETWKQGEHELRLSYRFEPGAQDDGVTVHIPLTALAALRPVGFDWLVPALREELVGALIRGLPKERRRAFAPVPDTAAKVMASLRPRKGTLAGQVAAVLGIEERELSGAELPPHLRMKFAVEDADGAVLAYGDDLEALRAEVRPVLRARLGETGVERSGLTDFAAVPRTVELPGVVGFPALTDEGATVGVRVYEDADRGRRSTATRARAPPARARPTADRPDLRHRRRRPARGHGAGRRRDPGRRGGLGRRGVAAPARPRGGPARGGRQAHPGAGGGRAARGGGRQGDDGAPQRRRPARDPPRRRPPARTAAASRLGDRRRRCAPGRRRTLPPRCGAPSRARARHSWRPIATTCAPSRGCRAPTPGCWKSCA